MNQKDHIHRSSNIKIGLFMTLGIGLGTWEKNGSLDRELAVYEYLISKGYGVTVFTYDKTDKVPTLHGSKIDVRTKIPHFLPGRLYWLYALLMPFLFYKEGKKLDVLKTNQAHSGWPAVWCGKIWRKKVIARCGYVFGESAETQNLKGFYIYRKRLFEKMTFKCADICFVPTPHLKKWVIESYNIAPSKIKLMPNNVDVDIFKPSRKQQFNQILNIIAVGRLAGVKRFDLLIASIANKNWTLTLIGVGQLKDFLERKAMEKKVSVEFKGNCPNEEIPKHLNKADVFVICSLREGHPKALIEAMACGCACVGTDSPGIREVIKHGETGLICSANTTALHDAIQMLLSDQALRAKLGENARNFAVKHYSLKSRCKTELEIITNLACA